MSIEGWETAFAIPIREDTWNLYFAQMPMTMEEFVSAYKEQGERFVECKMEMNKIIRNMPHAMIREMREYIKA